MIAQIDWHGLLVPTVSLLELVLRGSAMYLGILVLMRILRREAGALSTTDLLVVVLVADAAQNAMASEYQLHPAPLLLVKNGRVQRRNLRSEMLTMNDLKEQLREQAWRRSGR